MRGYKNFDSDPHPGDLRHMIEIGYTENQINENGYPEPTDVVVCKPGMWVRFQGDKWNISTLGEYSFKRTYLGLKASIAKGVSG